MKKANRVDRRVFLQATGLGAAGLMLGCQGSMGLSSRRRETAKRPNVVFLLADQWRAQATGYAGDPNVKTPHLDRLAQESVNLTNAVSGCPVCCPYRGSLMTGQYPLTHGVFLNDVQLNPDAVSIAKVYKAAGYETAYIGKWHLDGRGRSNFIPRERRQGFEFWKALECTHNYNNSFYYGDGEPKLKWEGYDAIAQTREAQKYIREHQNGKPFVLFLSWGPPHAPYQTAPDKYKQMFKAEDMQLRPNVPAKARAKAKQILAGYYAHIAALDDCVSWIVQTLKDCGLVEDTILIFTSDHGDMLQSRGMMKKQRPWEESIRVPFLVRYPALFGTAGREIDMPINTPDIMPTLLGLSGMTIPNTVEGTDYSKVLTGEQPAENEAVFIGCPSPFGQWTRKQGGREYRGVRTRRYTYVRDRNGPWLLYDNQNDPYQQRNLIDASKHAHASVGMAPESQTDITALLKKLDEMLNRKLQETHDEFLSGWDYIKKWGYKTDSQGTVPYTS
jgi:arylsulfatase A-like enzyme